MDFNFKMVKQKIDNWNGLSHLKLIKKNLHIEGKFSLYQRTNSSHLVTLD